MKSSIITTLGVCALLGAVLSSNAAVNLFPDGTFDSPAGSPGDWVEAGETSFSYPTTGGNPGGYGIMDATTAGWGIWVGGATTPVTLTSLGLTAGQTYNFVQDMRIESGTSIGGLKLESWGATGLLGDSGDMRPISGTATWATYSFSYTINPAATGLKIVPLWGPGSVVGFDNLGVNLPDPTPVAISITSPTNSAIVYSNFTISATATVYPGTVTNVDFYVDGALIGNDTTSPFSYAASVTAGNHAIYTTALDSSGNAATSGVVNVIVNAVVAPVSSCYESFNYPLGAFTNGTPVTGAGLRGNWTVPINNATVVAGLSYPNLPMANNGFQQVNNGSGRSLVNFSSTLSSGTEYIGCLIKGSGDSGGNWAGLYLKGDNATSLFAGFIGGYNGVQNFFSLGSVNSAGSAPTGGSALGTTVAVGNSTVHLVVLKIDFNTSGAKDTISLWIDPPAGVSAPGVAANVTYSSYDVGNISGLGLNLQGGSASFTLDEIRAGSTYADAVGANLTPTIPTTLALTIATSKQVTWTANNTSYYQPQKSTDNNNWDALGSLLTGSSVTSVYDTAPVAYYRILETASVTSDQMVDGAFEVDDGLGNPFYWTLIGSQAPIKITSDFHAGTSCMSLYVTNTATTPNTSDIQQDISYAGGTPIVGGNTYNFSFWAKQIGSGPSYVQRYKVTWLNGGNGVVGAIGWTTFTGGNGTWAQISSGPAVAPATAVNALIEIFGGTGAVANGFGGVLIDDVSLTTTSVSTGSPNILTPTVQSGAVFTATVIANGVTATAASGTVAFKTNSIGLSSGAVANGVAYSTPALVPDSYIVTATYSGDGTYIGSTSSLTVGNAVNTSPTNIVSTFSANQLTLAWPADHTGWTLQAQTNTLAKGISTNWYDVAGSASAHHMSFTVDPTKPTVFYRLKYNP